MFPEFLPHDGERTASELACEMDLAPILIPCPVRVIDVWREQFAPVAPGR
jgi:hypothetical protein